MSSELCRYGYLPHLGRRGGRSNTADGRRQAILDFQVSHLCDTCWCQFFQEINNLTMSGKLDNETLNLMESPRCDNPDVGPTSKRQKRNGRNGFSIKEQFGGTNGRWTKNDLTFKIVEYTQQVSTSEVGCCNCKLLTFSYRFINRWQQQWKCGPKSPRWLSQKPQERLTLRSALSGETKALLSLIRQILKGVPI